MGLLLTLSAIWLILSLIFSIEKKKPQFKLGMLVFVVLYYLAHFSIAIPIIHNLSLAGAFRMGHYLFFLLLLGVYICFFIVNKNKIKENKIFLYMNQILVLYCVASTIWSYDANRTFISGISLVILLNTTIAILSLLTLRQNLKVLNFILLGIALTSYIAFIYGGNFYLDDGRFNSIFSHPNFFGPLMAFGLLLNYYYLFEKKTKIILYLSLVAYIHLLILGHSATSIIISVTVLAIMLISKYLSVFLNNFEKRTVLLVFPAITFLIPLIFFVIISNVIPYTFELVERDFSLTGRVPFWSFLVNYSRSIHNWIFGYGYNGFFNPHSLESLSYSMVHRYGFPRAFTGQAHNGFIRVFIELGFIGLLLLVTVLITTYMKIITLLFKEPNNDVFFLHALWWFIVLANMTEDRFFSTNIFWVLFLVLCFYTQKLHSTSKKKYIPFNTE
ncbi:O-antigen ligase family protein [Chitinispirillales bacterium ANBcel5]|uniref:O-antigen ligase family protein n=1 Tax=Cellulosispirillum alkaliphilum TaxID=3039283 RepID=UPI002A58AA56|nr:O-antigen ligase family protein [Chitinispirillales bacterium ANBcel5]